MSQGQRVRMLRKELDLTLEKFAKPLGVGKTAISNIENESRNLTDQMIISICREYNVNEEWLRSGEGTPFKKLSKEEEIASYVEDLLSDGTENPLYEIILEIMRTYSELTPKSQEVLRDFSRRLLDKEDSAGAINAAL